MYDPFGPYFTINNFINNYTINIFCDASIQPKTKHNPTNGCYGAIAHYNGQVIDEEYRVCTDTTNNNSEIKAIRLAVCIALKYKLSNIPLINIFSDSQISVFGIRDRIYNWKLNNRGRLIGTNRSEIANQEIFIEIMRMMVDNNMYNIHIYHQKGHVNINNPNDINNASHVFCASNNVRENISEDFIKYISTWNNEVDRRSRKSLYKYKGQKCTDPIYFQPKYFNDYIYRYQEQNKWKRHN